MLWLRCAGALLLFLTKKAFAHNEHVVESSLEELSRSARLRGGRSMRDGAQVMYISVESPPPPGQVVDILIESSKQSRDDPVLRGGGSIRSRDLQESVMKLSMETPPPPGTAVDIPTQPEFLHLSLPIAPAGNLYTLVKVTNATTVSVVPLGRSYDGHGWEGVAPLNLPYATTVSVLPYTVELPVPSAADGEVYQLRSFHRTYDEELLTEKNVYAARFLERATFGPTLESIASFFPSTGNFSTNDDVDAVAAAWVRDQMYVVPPTSHRVYFRERARPHLARSATKPGNPRHACEAGSRWMRFALNADDYGKNFHVSGEGPPYLLSIDGYPRTELTDLFGMIEPNVTYKLGMIREHIGGFMKLVNPEDGKDFRPNPFVNPPVHFSENSPHQPPVYDLALPVQDGDLEQFLQVNETRDSRLDDSMGPPLSQRLLRPTIDMSVHNNSAVCSALPTAPQLPTHGVTTDGVWYLYDSRFTFRENEILSPMPDGGKAVYDIGKTETSKHSSSMCVNAPRNFLNEASCKLSTEAVNVSITAYNSAYHVLDRSTCGTVVCGSVGEVPTRPDVDASVSFELVGASWGQDPKELIKKSVLAEIGLKSEDQLRQRVAWALSQVLVVNEGAFELIETEVFVAYYDIFVRNAFGNYRDVLKEVAMSPMMAEMLTYLDNKSSQYVLEEHGERAFPDENFAREIMQLMTVGLVTLNQDGTPTDTPAYTNDDILDGARLWTGFMRSYGRGNFEGGNNFNRLDPLTPFAKWRDPYPKMDLSGGYVGDGYPLCVDLPKRPFLSKGAKFRLLGDSKYYQLHELDLTKPYDDNVVRATLDTNSLLYAELCGADPFTGECEYPGLVTLGQNLNCFGFECKIDTTRIFKVGPYFYEYQRVPCVEMSVFNDGLKIKKHVNGGGGKIMCSQPDLPAAAEACCKWATYPAYDNFFKGARWCEYQAERTTYPTAEGRCAINYSNGHCDWTVMKQGGDSCGQFPGKYCCFDGGNNYKYHWTNVPCYVQVKVDSRGKVAIVHEQAEVTHDVFREPDQDPVMEHVSIHSHNWFRVEWDLDKAHPNPSDQCSSSPSCVLKYTSGLGEFCLCTTNVQDDIAFEAELPIDVDEIVSTLRVGAFPPDMFDEGTYIETTEFHDVSEYRIWEHQGGPSGLDVTTIFEVQHRGRTAYYKNIISKVRIGDDHAFRNAPRFNSLVEPANRDILYETDAYLDSLFYHDNTAPFLAKTLIQRLGTSNPSPGYVSRVVAAFRDGKYEDFGSGVYGDLASTVAAIILDREALSPILDLDQSSGSLREPFIKVIGYMRAMHFQDIQEESRTDLLDLENKIGQGPYEQPSVFSFFENDHVPDGVLSSASLVSPEAYILTTPRVLGFLRGIFGVVKYGLNQFDGGFGNNHNFKDKGKNVPAIVEGNFGFARGTLQYMPSVSAPEDIVAEMGLLLTAGRCNAETLQIILDAAFGVEYDPEASLRIAQQLFASTPEFHATNIVERNGEARQPLPEVTLSARPYKAVIYLDLRGGVDSYNMLVPKDCAMYDKYSQARGSVVAESEDSLLPINVTSNGGASICDCETFGVHRKLPLLKELFDNGHASFLANVGILFEPSTKEDYATTSSKTSLFSHNTQQHVIRKVDISNESFGTGVLGRLMGVLEIEYGYKSSSTSLEGNGEALKGEVQKSPPINYVSHEGIVPFDAYPSSDQLHSAMRDLNGGTTAASGMFSETWSHWLDTSLNQNTFMTEAMSTSMVSETFPSTEIGQQLEQVARLVSTQAVRGTDRDAFYVSMRGFDTHGDQKKRLDDRFEELNDALRSFVLEMQDQEKWESVVIVQTSEFGRTLSSNGDGTDHGWGGHFFMLGGSLAPTKIHGEYPCDLTANGPYDTGRGRVLPTTPWESCWNAVAGWLGVEEAVDLSKVLPNRDNFQSLLTKDDIFATSTV